jgi:hypothetical protein
MRPLSGFSDILIALLLLTVASCASAPPASSSREPFQLEGSLRVEGDQPFNRVLILSDPEGVRWNLDPGDMEAELSLLDGYEVILTCSGIPGKSSERDAVVKGYQLVPPDGMIALLGNISTEAGAVFLGTGNMNYRLEGPLTAALEAFGGYRAWMWGTAGDGEILEVGGYEILGPQD